MVTAIHVNIATGPNPTWTIQNDLLNLYELLCINLVTLEIDPTGTCGEDEPEDIWLNTLSLFDKMQLRSIEIGRAEDRDIQAILDMALARWSFGQDVMKLESLKLMIADATTCYTTLPSLPQGEAPHLEDLDLTVYDGVFLESMKNNMNFTSIYSNPAESIQQNPSTGKQLPALKPLTFRHLGLNEPTSWPFAKWLAVLCPNVDILEVESLKLGAGPCSMDGVDVFVNSYFEGQRHLREVAPLLALTVLRYNQ
ncbi:hypothetical protein FRB95_000734 [Tulasnella sp. JGI-2019a]|nr:hypothetical protein FRB95_000734 [Tulasnella sp. JGI-2019a]